VSELFAQMLEMAEVDRVPDQVLPWEWRRFRRCARAMPHQAAQLGNTESTDLAEMLGTFQLGAYAADLAALGMTTSDVPFVAEGDLETTIAKPFHRLRFLRCARKLPVTDRQPDKYGKAWVSETAARYLPEAAGSPRGAGSLRLLLIPEFVMNDR
jgi:hypothetical protein